MPSFLKPITDLFGRLRARRPSVDHVVRAWTRYQDDGGGRLAATITYYGFLAFFPLVALAFAVVGYLVAYDPTIHDKVEDALTQALPGLIGTGEGQIDVDAIAAAKAGAGIIGIIGLLYAGLGLVDALRQSLRIIWHQNVEAGSFIATKLGDVVVLIGLGLALFASVSVSSGAITAADTVLGWVELRDSSIAHVLIAILAPVVAIVADVAVFAWLFVRLPRVRPDGARVLQGALLMAVCFEVFKLVGALYLDHTTSNPVYGTFATVVGLLVWINLVSRLLLFSAAWTITAPYADDCPPSGTAAAEGVPPGVPIKSVAG